jgi:hypothetical protein
MRWILMDGHLSWRTKMNVLYAAVAAAALTLSLSGVAGAVDLHDPSYGDDMENTNLSITENGETRQLILMNGETIYDICKACTITLENGKSVEASDFDLVETTGSALKVYKFPKTLEQRSQLPETSTGLALLLDDDHDASEAYDS